METKAFSDRSGRVMIWIAWLGFAGLLTWMFDAFLANRYNPNQRVESVISENQAVEVILQRNRAGHYIADGKINNQAATFLLDTGATNVIVPGELARRLALPRGRAHYAQTANGTITNYSTVLDSVSLGNLTLNRVRASINPKMRGHEVLLGMSFLKQLELVQRGEQLTIRKLSR